MSEPWAYVGSDNGWADPKMPPGILARLQRLEAIERAEAQREAEERAERAEARYQRCVWDAMNHAAYAGLPWDSSRPFEHWPSVDQRADALFAQQDAIAMRDDRLRAREAGLEHLMPTQTLRLRADEAVPTPADEVPAAPVTPARARIIDRARELRHRADGDDCCMCDSCINVRGARARARLDSRP